MAHIQTPGMDPPVETITEWREGNDRVVERESPGEDVEVEVIHDKNAQPSVLGRLRDRLHQLRSRFLGKKL
ncbi:hypothetical protein Moror_9886 [Moniliophthora roreri MCA 2997]|uniref:Uncharacterized protein n=2 Tax=Moniliophthora roreri TaxID=221103 RepID=V2X117_MONRO|nr:hypothetical protein Moror_9886 [Moniliophthora roreri MCA 2997]